MKTALLDVNVLAALMWPEHQHHAAAHTWWGHRGHARWATCPVTELGFLRLLMNPIFSRKALPFKNALALLQQAVDSERHEFWRDSLPASAATAHVAARIQGHRQITDAYLLSVARQHNGMVATFDSGMLSLAVGDYSASLQIIPTV